eukprot:5579286-Pyramimonas_sp.AAC.1
MLFLLVEITTFGNVHKASSPSTMPGSPSLHPNPSVNAAMSPTSILVGPVSLVPVQVGTRPNNQPHQLLVKPQEEADRGAAASLVRHYRGAISSLTGCKMGGTPRNWGPVRWDLPFI